MNSSNYDILRRQSWLLAEFYYKISIVQCEQKDYKKAFNTIDKAKQSFSRYEDNEMKLKEIPSYTKMGFKDTDEVITLKEQI